MLHCTTRIHPNGVASLTSLTGVGDGCDAGVSKKVLSLTPLWNSHDYVFAGYLYKHTYTYHIFIHLLFSLPCILSMAAKAGMLLAWLDFVPGTLHKSRIPKSSQASHLPESHAIHDHYLAVCKILVIHCQLCCLGGSLPASGFDASDILCLQQRNTMSVMRVDHSSHNARVFFCSG